MFFYSLINLLIISAKGTTVRPKPKATNNLPKLNGDKPKIAPKGVTQSKTVRAAITPQDIFIKLFFKVLLLKIVPKNLEL